MHLTNWLKASGEWSVSNQIYDFEDPSSGIRPGLDIDTAPNTLGTFRLRIICSIHVMQTAQISLLGMNGFSRVAREHCLRV